MAAFSLYKNGNIHTMDKALPLVEAMVTSSGKFAFVGSEAEARVFIKGRGAFDKEVNLARRLVVPGFNDSHLHLLHFAKNLSSVNLVGTKSITELKERMKQGLTKRKHGDISWLQGEGWNHDYFEDEKRFPNYKDLDEISTEVPIIILRACFHIGTLNSAAMKLIGLRKETLPEFGELAGRFSNGEPDGVLKESTLDDIKTKMPPLTANNIKELLTVAQEYALEQGLTSVQSDDIHYMPNADHNMFFHILQELERNGRMRIRLSEQTLFGENSLLEKFFSDGYGKDWGSDKISIGCIKILSDGSLGARTAAMREPYADDPSTKGLTLFSKEQLDQLVMTAHKNGCPIAIHCIGNLSLDMVMDAVEKAQKAIPSALRHGIVHCQITDRKQLERLAKLKMQTMVQPIFIDYDMNIVEQRVGAELAATSYAWRTMTELGINTSFGTDCPVESLNTMPNIYAAVTRKNITGDRREYLPGEKMTMEQAIYAYTAAGAYATNEENKKGTISAGKLADFITLDKDLFNLESAEDILDTKVLETYVGGHLEYKR